MNCSTFFSHLILLGLLALPTTAFAGDIECSHHQGDLQCKFNIDVELVGAEINGGECPVPAFRKFLKKGTKYIIPGSHECYYNRSLKLFTATGKVYKFVGM